MSGAVAFAFAAGTLSTVNPCGFAVLPAFLAYYLQQETDADAIPLVVRLLRSVGAGAAVSAGFAAVFTVAGLLLSAGLRVLIGIVPWAAVAVGVALVVLGVLLVAGRKVGLSVNANGIAGRRTGPVGLVLFGAGYALASLSCTVAVLLAVVGQALAAADVLAVLAVFAAYSAGAASVLVLLTVSAGLASGALTRLVRRVLPFVGRVSGAVLVLSGAYLVAYWAPQLLGARGATALSRRGGSLVGTLAQGLQTRTSLLAVLTVAVVLAIAVVAALRSVRTRDAATPASDGCCPAASPAAGSGTSRDAH